MYSLLKSRNLYLMTFLSTNSARSYKYLRTCLKEMGGSLERKEKVTKKLALWNQVLLEEISAQTHGQITPQMMKDTTFKEQVNRGDADEDAHDPQYSCVICEKYNSNQRVLWIECTQCLNWLHRKCDASLKTQRAWESVSAKGALYSCPLHCNDNER